MKKLKFIQVGITHEHAPGKMETLKRMSDRIEIVGYVDDRSFSVSPAYGPSTKPEIYQELKVLSLEEALNYPGLDGVLIEVPNNELVSVAMKFAEKGIAMHMDKPAGLYLDQYKKLLDLCKAKNVPFQMGYMYRGNPAFQFCIKAMHEELLGGITTMEADMDHCYGDETYDDYIGSFPGGIMYNLGCHIIDFFAAMMGRPEQIIPVMLSSPGYPDRIKNNCTAVLQYPHAAAVVRSCCHTMNERRVRICGTKATIEFAPQEVYENPWSIQMILPYGTLPNEKESRILGLSALREDNTGLPWDVRTVQMPVFHDRYEGQLQELCEVILGERQSTYSYDHDYLVHEMTLAASGMIPFGPRTEK